MALRDHCLVDAPSIQSRLYKNLGRATTAMTLIGGLAAASVAPALAQEASDGLFEEIIVRAQKREQSLTEVPVAISVFQEGFLQDALVEDLEDIEQFVAGFSRLASPAPRFSQTFIRGVGSLQLATASDSSVGYYVDDVLIPQQLQGLRLFDVEQIEVLKGPQGTVFGRGAQAGVVNIRTKRPDMDALSGRAYASIGDQGFYNFGAILNAPITDDLAVRFGGAYEETDENVTSLQPDLSPDASSENINAAATIFYTPTKTISTELGFSYSRDDAVYPLASGGFRVDGDRVFSGGPHTNKADGYVIYGKVTADIGDFNLMSITSYAHTDSVLMVDASDAFLLDGIFPLNLVNDPNRDFSDWQDQEDEFAQEFRLTPTSGDIDWIIGATYYSNDYDSIVIQDDLLTTGVGLLDGIRDHNIDREGWAVFGDATVPLGDRFSLSGGLRYAREDQDLVHIYMPFRDNINQVFFPGVVDLNVDEQTQSYDAFTGRVALSFDITDGATSYLSYSRGHKAGGYTNFVIGSAFGGALTPFDETFINTYEAGLKYQSTDGSFFGTAAVYFNDVKNEQVSGGDPESPIPFVIIFENVDVETYGVELEASYSPIEDLTLSANFNYTHTETQNDVQTVMAGEPLFDIPEINASFFIQYSKDVDIAGRTVTLTPNFDVTHVGRRPYLDSTGGTSFLDSYTLANASLRVGSGPTSLYLRAENVFNEDYELLGLGNATGGLDSFIFARLRRFSATLQVDF
ncbi:MAG: TonB-dependent receptor [Pseudomonadota bacterium]